MDPSFIVTAAAPSAVEAIATAAASANNRSPSVRSNCSELSLSRQDSNDNIATVTSGRINASYQTTLPPHYQPPSPSIVPPSAPQLPTPNDTHAEHTPRGQEETVLSSRAVNATIDFKQDPILPLPPTESAPFSPYHIEQLKNEKMNGNQFLDHSMSPPAFHPIQVTIAPSITSYPASQYHSAHTNTPDSRYYQHTAIQPQPAHSAASSEPGSSNTACSRPVPSDLEMRGRAQHLYQQIAVSPAGNAESKRNRGDAAVSSNILSSSLPSITDNSQSYADTDADGRRATRKKRTRENSYKARKSDAKAGVSAVGNGERIGASSPLSASTSNASLRTRTRSRDRDQDQERGVETSRTRSRRHRSRDRTTPTLAPHLESSIPTRDRLTLFRRAFSALELSNGRDRPSKAGIRKNHTVAWMDGRQDDYQHSSVSGTSHDPDSSRHFRNDMLARRRTAFGGSRRPRKTGIPGKNGEESETNVFNFVDIILNMPKDPSWQQVAMKLIKVLALLTIAYFALMALYFAAEFQSTTRLKNFNILVVDLDHSIIGNRFLNFTETDNAAPEQVNWMIQTGYKDVREIAADVERGLYWGAIVVQPNASTILNKALATPLSNYDPTKAFLFIYDGGRDPLVVKPYVVASMYTQFLRFTKVFNPTWVYIVLSFAAESNATLVELTEAPQVLGIPVAFEEMDLHPPTASIITSATSVAYIWIFLVAGGSTYMVAHIVQPMTRYASVRRTIVTLLLPLLLFLCSLSMAYSVLLRVFGVPFESVGQFMSLFMGILLLQAAVASLVLFLIFLIPVVFIPIITITFVVMNVIAVFNPVELMPVFYRWVYAMPFLNAVQMARFVLMGSYNRLSYNLPILFAWITIPITLLPFAITRQKRLMMEVLEMERQEWQQTYDRQQRYYFDNSQYRHREDHRFEDDNAENHELYGRDTVKKQRRWSHESVRPRSTRSRSHPRLGDDTVRDSDTRTRLDTADSDSDHSYNESGDGDGDQHSVNNTTHWVPPPNPLIFGSNASPSAPPESQVFDTHQSSSFIEMPKLSRHPYASELVRPHTPDEVK